MDKKAQGLSINVIIIVAIALIVLVVLVAVFTGRLGSFTKSIGSYSGDVDKLCSDPALGGSLVPLERCTGKVVPSKDTGSQNVCCVTGSTTK